MRSQGEGPAPQGGEPVRHSRSGQFTGHDRQMTALALLNEQTIAANISRYTTEQMIATVIDRMAFLRVSPEVFQATLEALRANMHTEVDRLIDEAVS